MRMPIFLIALIMLSEAAMAQQQRIVNSPHNLSVSGPGAIRASSEQEVCIFCHTPHNAAPVQPLWNRNTPASNYRVYSSNSLQALPGQPTGSSKLCLSCHDGTIALGSVLSRSQPIAMAGNITTLPPGATNLGTDLSDDHPISFKYDSALAQKNLKLKDPTLLPADVRLDAQREMQCTSCHNAHDNEFGNFLTKDNSHSQLCNSCHNAGMTTIVGHAECSSCHQQHSAPSGPYLLKQAKVSDTCLMCHNAGSGLNQGADVAGDFGKFSKHDTASPVNLTNQYPMNVGCSDCHAPHTMTSNIASAPLIPGRFGKINGVNASGVPVVTAQYEYEVCFKCHAEQSAVPPKISRQIVQTNLRLKFDPSAVSFHPVEAAGRNTNVPSLMPGLSTASIIYCNDCHNSDTGRKAGGAGPDGVHGSSNASLLIARYDTLDNTPESEAAYALCYKCHDRNSILANRSFARHKEHVVDDHTTCATCHDSHGISSVQGTAMGNSNLINFDSNIVQRDPVTLRLEFQAAGAGHGTCYLNCHGVAHSPKSY
ncbi:cytochrome c3 family protein [soil metagenome]